MFREKRYECWDELQYYWVDTGKLRMLISRRGVEEAWQGIAGGAVSPTRVRLSFGVHYSIILN